jgi:glycosyltransferase involved in cell wall biosynthesis
VFPLLSVLLAVALPAAIFHTLIQKRGENMNVLHLNRFFYSGQTTHVFALVREQQKQGLNARLIMDGYPTYQSLQLYKTTMEALGAMLVKPNDFQAACRVLQDWRPDLIHAHSSLTYPLALALAQYYNIPLILTCHGLGINNQENKIYLEAAAAIISISWRVAQSLSEFAPKLYIIPNGVDLQEFQPGPKEEPIKIAFVSRIDSAKLKGYNHLCKAVDLLEGVEFYVAANKKPNSKTARYLGWITNVADLLASTHIVVGTGRAVIEGLACGNAAVILGKTYQGILTPEKVARQREIDVSGLSGNTPCYRNMFYDLAKIIQNDLYLQELQQFSRQLAEKHFDLSHLTHEITALYQKF